MKSSSKQVHSHIVDDFEEANLSNWHLDIAYDYRAEGPVAKSLEIVHDPERDSLVLRVDAGLPEGSGGRLLVCRSLAKMLPSYRYRSISFWYRVETKRHNREVRLVCRLSRARSSNMDYLVATGKELSLGKWSYASLLIDKPTFDELIQGMRKSRPKTSRNVWATYLQPPDELCLIIEGLGEAEDELQLLVDDIRLEVKEEHPDYSPKIIDKSVDDVLKCLLVKQSAAGFYRFERALESLPGKTELKKSLFRGLHLPLSYFPRTLEELMSFDILILVDADPYVLATDQQKMLCDFVASGGALIVGGGPSTFGCSLGFRGILRDILPVKVSDQRDLVVTNVSPALVGRHFITLGIPVHRLGIVGSVHRLDVKDWAQVLLLAGDNPLMVVGEYHRGRVLVLNTYPRPDSLMDGSFFLSDQYDDLMRQAFQWLTKQEPPVVVTDFSVSRDALVTGEGAELKAKVSSGSEGEVTVRYSILKDGMLVKEEQRSLKLEAETDLRFELETEAVYLDKGDYDLRLEVLDESGGTKVLRDCEVKVVPSVELKVEMDFDKDVTAPGKFFEFHVDSKLNRHISSEDLDQMSLRTRILDFKGELIKDFGKKDRRKADYWLQVPPLLKGEYAIVSALLDRTGRVVDEVERKFYVVNEARFDEVFPLISIIRPDGGGLILDKEGLREKIEDHIAHGFNTVAVNGLRDFKVGPLPIRARLLNFIERYAQMSDQLIMYDYEYLTTTPRIQPTYPCVYSKEHKRSLENYLAPRIACAKKVPRLLCVKIIDEPTANENSIDYCQDCKRIFKEMFREELPSPQEDLSGKPGRKLRFRKFIRDYISKAYEETARVKAGSKADFRLLLTFMRVGFGYAWRRKWDQIEDAYAWGRHAEMVDYDIYPFFYPGSNKLGFRFLDIHYCFANLRNVAEFLGKPMGFYIELDDRNHPFQKNPLNASSECLYTALGAGANYINSFMNVAYATGGGSRAERWEDLGRELRKVASVAPILKKVKKPKAKVGLIFPYTHWVTAEDGFAPGYALELFLRAFGEADVIHEEVARAKGFEGYKVLLLLETDYLPDDIAKRIETFIQSGGALFCDHVPKFNEEGEPCKLSPKLFSGQDQEFIDGLRLRKGTFGEGKTILLDFDLDKTYAEAVERPIPERREALERLVQECLFGLGLKPKVSSSNPEFEANLLEGKNSSCLVLVNHNSVMDSSTITVHELGFKAGYVYDLTTMEELDCTQTEILSIKVTLGGRCGKILGIYTERPATTRVEVDPAEIVRGQGFSYRVILGDAEGRPTKGHHLLDIAVVDPEGYVHTAYGGSCATIDGVYSRSAAMALNAVKGKWTIKASDSHTKHTSQASFLVR